MTVGNSTIALAGTMTLTSGRRETEIGLSESIGELEVKGPIELTVKSGETVTLPLSLSSGVDEILFLYLYSPKKMIVRVTGKDASHPGPLEKGLKGYWIEMLTPGAGYTEIEVTNPSNDEYVTIEYGYGAKGDAADEPTFYNDD